MNRQFGPNSLRSRHFKEAFCLCDAVCSTVFTHKSLGYNKQMSGSLTDDDAQRSHPPPVIPSGGIQPSRLRHDINISCYD